MAREDSLCASCSIECALLRVVLVNRLEEDDGSLLGSNFILFCLCLWNLTSR